MPPFNLDPDTVNSDKELNAVNYQCEVKSRGNAVILKLSVKIQTLKANSSK